MGFAECEHQEEQTENQNPLCDRQERGQRKVERNLGLLARRWVIPVYYIKYTFLSQKSPLLDDKLYGHPRFK